MSLLVRFSNVRIKSGLSDKKVLKCPDFELIEGQSVLIKGESGSGKGLILRIAAGLLKNYEGLVERRKVSTAFVFADGGLQSNLTVEKNILLPLIFSGLDYHEADKMCYAALQNFNLLDVANQLSGTLSKELIRVVQYARADALRPKLLCIEEPYAGIDARRYDVIDRWLKYFLYHHKGGLLLSTSLPRKMRFLSPKLISLSGSSSSKTLIM